MTERAGRGGYDDLGASMLIDHPRGEQWSELDVTVTALTFEQIGALADRVDLDSTEAQTRARARDKVIVRLDPETRGRLGSRWVRWCSTLTIEQPPEDIREDPGQVLGHPFELAARLQHQARSEPGRGPWARYVRGVSAVFDAALGIAGTGLDPAGSALHSALTGPWAAVCLPSQFGPGDVFGPHHRPAVRLLRHVTQIPAGELAAIAARRVELGERWQPARERVYETSLATGFPFRAAGLYWETIAAAEEATRRSPTDLALVEGLWGAAAAIVFAEDLDAETHEVLSAPWAG